MTKLNLLRQRLDLALLVAIVALVALTLRATATPAAASAQQQGSLAACQEAAFSTEQRFLSRGPAQPDGIPTVSDGDLLSPRGVVCLRNRQLLAAFQPAGAPPLLDLGLDAADIITVEPPLVAFSTELDDPLRRFGSGDLLATNGAVIPNFALLRGFGVDQGVGLDEVKFIGKTANITRFLEFAREQRREVWLELDLRQVLTRYEIDLWFSIEGTVHRPDAAPLLDGDILSARDAAVVLSQDVLLAPPLPAGLPARGVDFGLDAFAVNCAGDRASVRFSTEIVYRDDPARAFSDGDLLKLGGAVERKNCDFVQAFEPLTTDLGLDAVSFPPDRRACEDGPRYFSYLPLILQQVLRAR